MIPRTLHKLEEAKFFLAHLQQEDKKVVRTNPKAFLFYLSAFLSAGRSVTFVLQKEDKDAYEAVFPKWRETLAQEENELLDFMKDQRNFELKQLGATTETTVQAVPAELEPGFQVFGSPRVLLGEERLSEEHFRLTRDLGLPVWCTAWVYKTKYMFRGKKEPSDATTKCERYMALLDRFVQNVLSSQSGAEPPTDLIH